MTIIKAPPKVLSFNEITQCPRCSSDHIIKLTNHKRIEDIRNHSYNRGTDVSIRCKDCNCLVHYKD